jgi:hypothetical protein
MGMRFSTGTFSTVDENLGNCLRLVRVSDYRPGHHLTLVMDDKLGRAVAYLDPDIR